MKPRSNEPWRGVSLIELMVALTVGAVVAALAIGVLARLLAVNRAGQEHLQRSVSLGRVADQFRRDVHAADDVSMVADKQAGLRLKMGTDSELQVEYKINDGRLDQMVREGDDVRAREVSAPSGTRFVRFELDADREPAIARLVLAYVDTAAAPQTSQAEKTLSLEASVGRDHRFVARENRP